MKKSIHRLFFMTLLLFATAASAQTLEQIRWMDFEKLSDTLQTHPKKVLISFHTEWCTYCKKMNKEVYTDPEIIKIINEDYYAVQFDAESQDSVFFDGQLFINSKSTKRRKAFHDLALILGSRNGQFTVPVTLMLKPNFELLHARYHYLDRKTLKRLILSLDMAETTVK